MRASLQNQAILVTGGAGFIGSALIDSLLSLGVAHVYVIDNMFTGNEANLKASLAAWHRRGVCACGFNIPRPCRELHGASPTV